MSPELAQLNAKLDRVLRLLEQKPKPYLSQREFGRLIRKHPNTICRWVAIGKITTRKGRIPATELAKFASN